MARGKGAICTASFLYSICDAVLHVFQIKWILGKEGEAFDRMVKKFGNHQNIKGPSAKLRKKYDYQTKMIGGQPCYIVNARENKAEKSVLLFFGGGYFMPPDQGDFVLAGEIAKNTGAAFCLTVCLYIRHEKLFIPFPGRLIMLSPGLQMPPGEEQI